jgi:glycosyltransferase involved in cell wall biosynthesis
MSSAATRFSLELGASPSRICVIPNSVDTSVFCPRKSGFLQQKWGISGPVILFVGRLTAHKGLEVLVRAYDRIESQFPRANLVIVGRGPDEEHLRTTLNELQLRQVSFLGLQPWSVMKEIYPECEFLVLPSFYEPFGNVVLEAMACGLPVIGSKIGGMADIISHGETGFHIIPGNVEQLTKYMRMLLADRTLHSRMSRSARKAAEEKFDDVIVAKSVERLYRNCLDRN